MIDDDYGVDDVLLNIVFLLILLKISKFESFTRQVNGWGFKRITQGPDINSYYHELFLQGMPHLIQWMKRATSSGLGKRKCRSDPRDEPDFYEISKRYPIPDYYNENGGKPIASVLGSGEPHPDEGTGHHNAKQHREQGERQLPKAHKYHFPYKHNNIVPEPVVGKYQLSPPEYQYHQHPSVLTPQRRTWNNSNGELPPVDQTNDHHGRGATEDNDQNSMLFSPTCYYSPGTKIGRELKELNVLRDINVDDFWRNVPPREHSLHPAAKKESDLFELYDVPAPLVSNEESSGSPDGDVVSKHQWQSLYDSLVDTDEPHTHAPPRGLLPRTIARSEEKQSINEARNGYTLSVPRLPPGQNQPPSYHCSPRLSRPYHGLRQNYSGHIWRGHHYHDGYYTTNDHNSTSTEVHQGNAQVAIQNNNTRNKRTADDLHGETKDVPERSGHDISTKKQKMWLL